MSKRAHLSFRSVVPVIALSLIAFSGCGDDESAKDAGTAGKAGEAGKAGSAAGKGGSSGAAGASGSGGRGGASGGTGSGSVLEGDGCNNTAECATGLVCVTAAISQDTGVRICARPCTLATEVADCGTESCESDTGRAQDAHCRNYEPAPFAACGVGVTAACGGERSCLYYPDVTVGVCIDVCALDPTQDAGADLLEKCPGSLSCVADVVDKAGVGICATEVKRDEVCGIEMLGKLCTGTDICVPDDLANLDSTQHCREDCTKSGACTTGGTCTAVRDAFSYCKK